MTRTVSSLLLLLALLSPATPASTGRQDHRFYGYAFEQKTGRYLYTEVHHHVYQGERWVSGSIRYFAPDGQLIGQKTLDFSADPYLPVFHLSLPGQAYEEGISSVAAGSVEVDTRTDGQRASVRLDRVPGMVADSGFHSFVVNHLDDLQHGRPVSLDLIAAGRLADYRFRLVKVREDSSEGHPTLQLRAEPDSWLRVLVPPLLLTYDLQTRHLVEYQGPSNLRGRTTGVGPLVRLVYPERPPAGAPGKLPPLDTADGGGNP